MAISTLLSLKIRESLLMPLPGWEGQKELASKGYDTLREPKPDSKQAAVLLLLNTDPDTEELCLTYIKRPSNNPHDKHGGQISFPGGQREPHDKDLKETAIRETEEELGLSREHFEVLGPISKVYVFVSDFNVQPYVGYAKEPLVFAPQKSEVDYVINYPLKKLVTNPILSKDHTIRGFTLKDIPYYNLQGETLWGATGMMTAEFLKIINDYNLHRLL